MSKVYQWTPFTSLGFLNDELDAIWAALGNLRPAVFRASGSDNITTTAATVSLDTSDIANTDYYTLTSNLVRVKIAGTYDFGYSIPVDDDSTSGATRGRVYAWLERKTTPVAWSRSQDYAREASGGQGVAAGPIPIVCTANDEIRLRVQASSTVDISTRAGEPWVSVRRVGP